MMRRVLLVSLLLGVVATGVDAGARKVKNSSPPQMGQNQTNQNPMGTGSSRLPSSAPGRPSILDDDSQFPGRERMQEQAMKGRNSERFRRLVADTNKLLQLSNELKVEVDGTTKNELSVSVIQKAAEIEKLAHDVKERMKGQ